MKRITLLLSLFTLLLSCASDQKQVVSTSLYSLELPSFLNKANGINEDASLEYQNLFKEFYTIVIDETKKEFNDAIDSYDFGEEYQKNLTGYSKIVFDSFEMGLEIIENKDGSVKVGEMNAIRKTMDAKIDGLDVFYHVSIIEGKDHYYQILSWTLLNKKEEYKSMMVDIEKSFKEI